MTLFPDLGGTTNGYFAINGCRFYPSATEPTTKVAGKTYWMELSSGIPKYGWWWWWDGIYWRSPDFTWDTDVKGVNAPPTYNTAWLRANSDFNYYLKSATVTALVVSPSDASNYWTFTLQRRPVNNTSINIQSISTGVANANAWAESTAILNTHVNLFSTATKVFNWTWGNVGSPGALYAAIQLTYNFARP